MFIEDFVPVRLSLVVANAWLLSDGSVLAGLAAAAGADQSDITLGPARRRSEALVIPFEWSALGTVPFRRLEGDLATTELGPTTTHLQLSGSCQLCVTPPGTRRQEGAAQRETELRVRAFLAALADALEHPSRD